MALSFEWNEFTEGHKHGELDSGFLNSPFSTNIKFASIQLHISRGWEPKQFRNLTFVAVVTLLPLLQLQGAHPTQCAISVYSAYTAEIFHRQNVKYCLCISPCCGGTTRLACILVITVLHCLCFDEQEVTDSDAEADVH